MSGLRCTVPRIEAALAYGPLSAPCPKAGACPMAGPSCLVFAPGWYCEERDLIVFPDLLRDADDEPDDYA
jgi:hypothetical protein